jgi:hypothetical protein
MVSCTLVRRQLVASVVLLLLLQAALGRPPGAPTEAEVREHIQQLERTKDLTARVKVLQWFHNHAEAQSSRLAIPVLERTTREGPVTKVRVEAILALYQIARKQKLPCPLALVQAIFDKDEGVRDDAGGLVMMFSDFAPGTVELAFRGAWSEDENVRNCGLNLVALVAPRDEKALAVLETAKNDRSFQVRHNSYCYKFKANNKVDELLAWMIRLQDDDSILDPVPKDEKVRNLEKAVRNLAIIGSARQICEWCEQRPDELAAALLQLLDHQSPVVRRGAMRLIGVTAVTPGPSKPRPKDDTLESASAYLFLEPELPPTPGGQPKDRLEKSKVALFLEKCKVRERLKKLSDNDPDRAVRRAALLALDRLARLHGRP